MRALLSCLLCSVCAHAAAPGSRVGAAERVAARTITADYLKGHLRFLSSDLLEGRGPGTRGDRLAQEYIAAQFEALGLRPGAPGSAWYQPFDLVGVTGNPQRVSLQAGAKRLDLRYGDELIAVAGAPSPESRVEAAEVVFVGYGIVAPEYQWDDYKGVDLRGKVLLMMNNDPESDPSLFAGPARLWYGRWDYKYEQAAKRGAVGAILIHTTPSAGYPWQVVQTSWSGEQLDLSFVTGHGMQLRGWTTEDASRRLAALGGHDLDALRKAAQGRDFRPVPLGVQLTTSFKNDVQKKRTANVLGVLPGSDPALSRELVVLTAHFDHLGRNATAKPGEDDIYNGAVDNASGVGALLAIARAASALPRRPRRSILFAAVAAEEQGLLGSQYLMEHPPVPAGAMAANINIDGVNIWGRTRDVSVIGLGKSSLDGLITHLAASQGRAVKADQLSDRGFFYRSDQFNFARQGVPSAYFGSGMDFVGRPEGWGRRMRDDWEEKHYHQPSDQVSDSWDLSGAVEDAQLYFLLAVQVAQDAAMPEWVRGDEFEATRKRSLEKLRGARAAEGVGR